MTIEIELTLGQEQQIRDADQQQGVVVANTAHSLAISSSQFVFFAAFDGTNNDLTNRPQKTNAAQLQAQVADVQNNNVIARYYPGTGAKGTLFLSSWLSPQVTRQVIKQAERAYSQFVAEARNRLVDNPSASVTTAIASFSRGGASAAMFTQLLYANGLVDTDGHVLIAPGQIPVSAGVLFDPVLTSVSGNLALAPNVTNVVDILARDEYRELFKAADYRVQPDIVTIVPMFGAHSDIGGAYDSGIGAIALQAATDFFIRSGLAIAPVPPERQFNGTIVLHSEGDAWTEYASFQSTDLSQNPRLYDSVATPATLTTLEGRSAKTLLLFDGRTITISDLDSDGIEKVKLGSVAMNSIERQDITTYRIDDSSTSIVDKTEIVRNTRIDAQRIEAQIFEGTGKLEIYVPSAHTTSLSVAGGDGVNADGALILGDDPAGYRFQGGRFERRGSSSLGIWRDEATGVTYELRGGTLEDGNGSLVIRGGPLGDRGGSVTIQDFVDGKLGISLEDKQAVEISSASAELGEGGLATVTVEAASVSDKARVVRLHASDFQGNVAGVLGDEIQPFVGGELDLLLPAGQSRVTFGLLEQGDIDAGGTFDLTVTLLDPDGTAAASDAIGFAMEAAIESTHPPATTRDIVGGFSDGADDLGNHFAGTFDPNRDDVLADSAGNDHVTAGGGNDSVFATLGGDDWIELGAGDDAADAGPGDDLVVGQDGRNVLFGGTGNDRLFAGELLDADAAIAAGASAADAGADGDFLNGNEGDDLLVGDDAANVLEGGAGDDRIVADGGNDVIEADGDLRGLALGQSFTVTTSSAVDVDGSAAGTVTIAGEAVRFAVDAPGNDLVHAGGGDDYVFTGAGNDVAYGEDGADHAFGEAGDDALFGGEGNDVLSGDNGGSALDYALHGQDLLDGGAGDDTLCGNGAADALYGGDGNDILIGDSSKTNAGDDYLSGEAGDDQLRGGMGRDTLLGGDGGDTLIGDGGGSDPSGDADFLDGGAGDDTLLGQGGDDVLVGGAGTDFLQGDDGADLLDGGEGSDTLLGGMGEDSLEGGAGDDLIAGDKGGESDLGDADLLSGGAGDDTLAGQGGDDVLLGGDGHDTLDGGDGADMLEADAGDDRLQGGRGDDWLDGGEGGDTILGGQGSDMISGGAGADILVGDDGVTDALGDADFIEGGAGDDQIDGQIGDDALSGDEGNDLLYGGDGADQLDGGAGDDTLFGEAGDDSLAGGEGIDYLFGGRGDDTLAGGAGEDLYRFNFLDGGIDYIDDEGPNTLFLGGIVPAALRFSLGSLVLSAGDPANELHLENFDPDDVAAGSGIDKFVFIDIGTFTYEQLIARGIDIAGTQGAEIIEGTSGKDNIQAFDGDDYVIAKSGDDAVDLGSGDDVVEAGEGDDAVSGGDGGDVLLGGGGDDTLDGGEGQDRLLGGEGNDILEGGAGADALAGGIGDDTYVVDALDEATEEAGAGIDTIDADIDYTLPDNFEKLVLVGAGNLTGTGNSLDNVIVGNTGDNFLFGMDGDDVIQGGGGPGIDTLDGGAGNDSLRLDGGDFSTAGTLLGGEGDDGLFGNFGPNRLDGGPGADGMLGSAGDDLYVVDDAHDRVVEDDGWVFDGPPLRNGRDTVQSSISFALPYFVEDLVLTGTAGINGTGNSEENVLQGNDGANELVSTRLDGLNDNLASGAGTARFSSDFPTPMVERLWDRVLARYFEGEVTEDEINSNDAVIEVAARRGDSLIGNGGNDRLIGGWDDDTLDGGAGDDFLAGSGGADVLAGGAGDDTYLVDGRFHYQHQYINSALAVYHDDSADQVLENEDAGRDTVYSNLEQYRLDDNIENLVLLDARDLALLGISADDGLLSTDIARVGMGNELDNVLAGNARHNELYGGAGSDVLLGREGDDILDGESGADTMAGGTGDDSYYVDDPDDLVVEDALSGYDRVDSDIDYTLTANVEALQLEGETFLEPLAGTGNELDNSILGNAGANVLSGREGDDELDGGFGADFMEGGAGNDSYWVDDAGDVTLEEANQGRDLVRSTLTHRLGANLEDLELQSIDRLGNFVGAIDGTGNELDNWIIGNLADNVLSGLEGDDALYGNDGWDTLYGGEGNDTLDGGWADDTLVGGAGDDLYAADTFDEIVVEAPDEGADTVQASDSFELPANVENLNLLSDYVDGGLAPNLDGRGNELDNVIVGNDGSNGLQGLEGDDRVDGRAGNDQLSGDDGNDALYGGDDAVFAGSSYRGHFGFGGDEKMADAYSMFEVLAGNSDSIYGGLGNDSLDGGSGDDELYGQEGDDVLFGGTDGLSVDAERGFSESGDGEEGSGSDAIADGRLFLTNNDSLHGGEGDDVLDGGSGDDALYGDDGSDRLYGGDDGPLNTSNDDYLDGGAGVDFMAGGTGDDLYSLDGTYVVELRDVIDDCGELHAGVPTRVWTTDTVLENPGEGYDGIYANAEITLPSDVEWLRLQPGAALVFAAGNDGDNTLLGNGNDNVLHGGAGNDVLGGDLGDDVLDGGAGDDVLYGEGGNDTYEFGLGGGRDRVYGYGGGFDVVHMRLGIAAADLMLSTNGSDVTIAIDGTGDRLTLVDWFSTPTSRVREIRFCDGSALGEADMAALARQHTISAGDDFAAVLEDGPATTGNVLLNDSGDGTTFSVASPGSYAGELGTLLLAVDGSYAYAPGDAQWLAEGESRTDFFAYEVEDDAGAHDGAAIAIDVVGQNDAPRFAAGSVVGEVREDRAFPVIVESGNLLVNGDFESFDLHDGWSVDFASGFDGVTDGPTGASAYFGGTGEPVLLRQEIQTAAGESLFVRFRVHGGASRDASFDVRWNGEALAALEDVVLFDDTCYVYEVSGVDGASLLEIAARNDHDFWYLDGVEVVPFERSPSIPEFQSADGALEFADVDASDTHVVASVTPDSPDYLGSLSASIERDSTWGDSGLVSWFFDVANAELQFLGEGESLVQSYAVTLVDSFGSSATRSITVVLHGANDAPFAEDDEASVNEDHAVVAGGNVLANDGDIDAADTLCVANAGTYAGQYGTLVLAPDGTYTYTLDDARVDFLAHGERVEERFDYEVVDSASLDPLGSSAALTLFIDGANDAPVTQTDSAVVTEDAKLIAGGNVLANDRDPDQGTVLTVANPGTYSPGPVSGYGTLEIAADGSYTFMLDNDAAQALGQGELAHAVFMYQADDGDVAEFPAPPNNVTPGLLDIEIQGANDAPSLTRPIADQHVDAGTSFVFAFAADTFSDIDQGDSLTYVATLADGSALPQWLSFDPGSRTFSGTPSHAASLQLRVTARDSWQASAIADFVLTVAAATGNGQHIVGTDGDDVLAGTPYDDVVDGGNGYDIMNGGDGDDVYYADATCTPQAPPTPGHDGGDHQDERCAATAECQVDLVVEQAGQGYDIVYASADYRLPDNVEELRLIGADDLAGAGNALDNVLAGNAADNFLAGGLGADTYVHEQGGGDDVIEETGADSDTLELGAGISAHMVSLKRRNDDLVVDIAGAHDSVTVKGWFASASKHIETIRLSDGTSWSVRDVERAVHQDPGCPPPSDPSPAHWDRDDHNNDERDRRGGHERQNAGAERRDEVAEAIASLLGHGAGFDFTRLHGHRRPADEREIAARWREGAAYDYALGAEDGAAHEGRWMPDSVLARSFTHADSGFGFEASIGAPRGPQELKGFLGLAEGFRRL